ncbi:MAG TPA: DISARM system SNF2-like helicase DrmD, partial [Polyangiaceae bacterium LLY-WYZ-14_1]|nr:DISARM system SNF2-like helicase DrmD [Polyangiaceae bacterium LLY-WYZ-14_1]
LRVMGRDELKSACRALGLEDAGRGRQALMVRLLEARGDVSSAPPPPSFGAGGETERRFAPRPGDVVRVRHRQWLVEAVATRAPETTDAAAAPARRDHLGRTRVHLVCLDDDHQGRELVVFWELELGAEVLHPESQGLGQVDAVDAPRHFAAYLHALKWSSVTATDATLLQAPFRAGIKLMAHQLTPLRKALELPRANLFIADDVGLGKTIEAGLVLQELLLRQRVEFVLIVCPAAVALQWRDEMERRFGLSFEIMSRAFIARRRQERGFGVNPWATHHRFIISHQTLRRPEYRDPLLQLLGERRKKSLLILDEAHVAAPSSASKYAIDSRITRVIRAVAPRFENRLFLSATPHNGHSNSFSALLEILDPQRFTRGVPIDDHRRLEPVMVRRLKEDLRRTGADYPIRKLVQLELRHEAGRWQARSVTWNPGDQSRTATDPVPIGRAAAPVELQLSAMLAEYTTLMRPERGRGRLVFVNLQKRLLSSVEAFARTLQLHARRVREGKAGTALDLVPAAVDQPLRLDAGGLDDDTYGADDDALEASAAAEIDAASAALRTPAGRAWELLDQMERLAQAHRAGADGKVLALLDWIRTHQCPAVRLGGADPNAPARDRRWTDRRILVFTEYGDTKRWLRDLLRTAVAGTDDADQRIRELHGGMGDDARDEVQRAFNDPTSPVRILLATDAAREGVNLQGACADLFHFDIPWNPARMEQRNGRIDRTLQPSPEVRCHYVVYPQRAEDTVLEKLVQKVDVIQRELGSLSSVLMDRIDLALDDGIDGDTGGRLDEAASPTTGDGRDLAAAARAELEAQRADERALIADIERAGKLLQDSRRVLEFDPALLRDALDVGFELAGAGRLTPAEEDVDGVTAWTVPALPDSWQPTLDTLRPPRGRDEPFWQWRRRPPQPVLFEPPATISGGVVHLHLEHPLVQRVLGRFRAQGFSAHDLSRVTVVRTKQDSLIRVIAFGRLSIFGRGATRLHDELVSVAARWVESSDAPLRPFAEDADRRALAFLEQTLAASPTLDGIPDAVRRKVRDAAPGLFRDLWTHIEEEADARATAARAKLATRAREESDALRALIETQRNAIVAEIDRRAQIALDFTPGERDQREQYEQDRRHMDDRLVALQRELETEPGQIESLYEVALRRLEPVGLVVLWPETRA